MSVRNLDRLMAPRSVVLIGASPRPGSLGASVLARLRAGGFGGTISLVHPRHREIDGMPCTARVEDLETPPDLAVIVSPPRTVPEAVAALGRRGTRAAVVLTPGIERGGETARAMLRAARPHTLRILGPGSLGLQLPALGLDASYAHLMPRPGRLALVSQSGAVAGAMTDWAEARGIGFSAVASLGDMADVDTGDLLDHLASDAATRAILLYLEHVTDARKFLSAARAAARTKPVIAVKSGRSRAAARAAHAHSGARPGTEGVFDAAFRRAGVLRVAELEDLFDAAEALSRHPPLHADRLAIVGNGGGAGVLAADALAARGGRLAALSETTRAALADVLPEGAPCANPVDLGDDADAARYRAALAPLLDEKEADAVLVMHFPTALDAPQAVAEAVVEARRGARKSWRPKPVFAAWLGEATARAGEPVLEAAGIPAYRTPDQAVRGFAHLAEHRKAQVALMRMPPALPEDAAPNRPAARAAVLQALDAGRARLSEPEARAVLRAYGIPTLATRLATDPGEAASCAAAFLAEGAGAVAVKILSPDIRSKSEVGGVRLNLASPAEASEAAEAVLARLRSERPEARIEGVAVQPMAHRPEATELMLGIVEDEVFGPVVAFGAGGTASEIVEDRALALPPLDLVLADDLVGRTRVARLLDGFADRAPADREGLTLALVNLARLGADMPEITGVEINPLLADARGVIALDTRITVAACPPAEPGQNPRFALRPYPSAWDRVEEVKGRRYRIRPVRPEDETLYPDFFASLSARDMKYRFFGMMGRPGHEQIARFTQIDYARAMAFVALPAEGEAELLGVSRISTDPDRTQAEFAVIVRSDLKGTGLGGALMRRLIAYSRAEGIRYLYGEVLDENRGMLGMCRHLGFAEREHPEDRSLQIVEMDPAAAEV